jgi:hypothetical protein
MKDHGDIRENKRRKKNETSMDFSKEKQEISEAELKTFMVAPNRDKEDIEETEASKEPELDEKLCFKGNGFDTPSEDESSTSSCMSDIHINAGVRSYMEETPPHECYDSQSTKYIEANATAVQHSDVIIYHDAGESNFTLDQGIKHGIVVKRNLIVTSREVSFLVTLSSKEEINLYKTKFKLYRKNEDGFVSSSESSEHPCEGWYVMSHDQNTQLSICDEEQMMVTVNDIDEAKSFFDNIFKPRYREFVRGLMRRRNRYALQFREDGQLWKGHWCHIHPFNEYSNNNHTWGDCHRNPLNLGAQLVPHIISYAAMDDPRIRDEQNATRNATTVFELMKNIHNYK